jgi:ketosteroid isomerase-like protein
MSAVATMTDGEIRELCTTFFDAYQDRRVDILDRVLADDCIIWHNVFGRETTKADNLSKFHDSYQGQRRRTYDDRTINTFDDGFVIQYSLNGVMHNGHRGSLWICIVARVRDGLITRIDEYMDSSKFASWAGAPDAGTSGATPSEGDR